MNKVYVVQRPAYYDRQKKGWVNKYDLAPAEEHGELVYMLRPGNVFRERLDDAVARLEECLAGYTEDDFILAVGDPVAIAAAAAVAARNTGGYVTVLKFDRHANSYIPYPIKLS